jgi:hypothetical protein
MDRYLGIYYKVKQKPVKFMLVLTSACLSVSQSVSQSVSLLPDTSTYITGYFCFNSVQSFVENYRVFPIFYHIDLYGQIYVHRKC